MVAAVHRRLLKTASVPAESSYSPKITGWTVSQAFLRTGCLLGSDFPAKGPDWDQKGTRPEDLT